MASSTILATLNPPNLKYIQAVGGDAGGITTVTVPLGVYALFLGHVNTGNELILISCGYGTTKASKIGGEDLVSISGSGNIIITGLAPYRGNLYQVAYTI